MQIDLNCDLGEDYGNDDILLPLITSANVACGFHAGSIGIARRTIAQAQLQKVVVGAHPGYRDREHFGRKELAIEPEQVYDDCVYQIAALRAMAQLEQSCVKYVKPHGALYHQANREVAFADAVIEAAKLFDLIVLGLPGSQLQSRALGRCAFAAEGFADRRYRRDGTLTPRDQQDAFIVDPDEAMDQIETLVRDQGVQSICIHGDNPDSPAFAKRLRAALLKRGYELRSFA